MRVNLLVRTVLYSTVLYCTVPAGADTPHGVVHGGLVQDLAPEHGLGAALVSCRHTPAQAHPLLLLAPRRGRQVGQQGRARQLDTAALPAHIFLLKNIFENIFSKAYF